MDFQCLSSPLRGCSDVGAEFDSPADDETCNDACRADCIVTDVFERGTVREQRSQVPSCLEICSTGPCPGNSDRMLAYAEGHPLERDPNLPVPACWQVTYRNFCPDSNFSGILVSRQSDPPPRSFAEVECRQIPQSEEACDDGLDNDEDCLVDQADPDCS